MRRLNCVMFKELIMKETLNFEHRTLNLQQQNWRVGILSLLICALCAVASAVEPLRALMITGGCCHDYEAQKKILSEGISARANVTWTIIHEGGDSRDTKFSIYNKPDWTKGFDVVVHNECSGFVTNVDWVEHIAKGHFEGVP